MAKILDDDFDANRKLELSDVNDAFFLWSLAAEKCWFDKAAQAEDMCLSALKYAWGDDAKCEFNYDQVSLVCTDDKGSFVKFEREKEPREVK